MPKCILFIIGYDKYRIPEAKGNHKLSVFILNQLIHDKNSYARSLNLSGLVVYGILGRLALLDGWPNA